MLHEFLAAHREELTKRCRAKVAGRRAPQATECELQFGIPLFLDQLIDILRVEETAERGGVAGSPGVPPAHREAARTLSADLGSSAEKHGDELLRHGFSVDQVVHDYGDLCQAITALAQEHETKISVEEFRIFNRCLDDAIADAVSEYGRQRDHVISEAGTQNMNERLGNLAHELRNLLNSAMLAFQAIKNGNVALNGATGAVLGRSLIGMRDLVDRSLAEVRLTHGLQTRQELIFVRQLFEEIQVGAAMEAKGAGIAFTVRSVDGPLTVHSDRQMLSAAIVNLLQNAFKFSRPNGSVSLSAELVADRVLIDIADECGGLAEGEAEALFQPFRQGSGNRTGLGLGPSISRRSVEANGGKLSARNVPGTGCVFSIDLPAGKAQE